MFDHSFKSKIMKNLVFNILQFLNLSQVTLNKIDLITCSCKTDRKEERKEMMQGLFYKRIKKGNRLCVVVIFFYK